MEGGEECRGSKLARGWGAEEKVGGKAGNTGCVGSLCCGLFPVALRAASAGLPLSFHLPWAMGRGGA